jgi:hypothetical protein
LERRSQILKNYSRLGSLGIFVGSLPLHWSRFGRAPLVELATGLLGSGGSFNGDGYDAVMTADSSRAWITYQDAATNPSIVHAAVLADNGTLSSDANLGTMSIRGRVMIPYINGVLVISGNANAIPGTLTAYHVCP